MSFLKKTKIVATLGPSTRDIHTLEEMILAGTNVFRINFSHVTYSVAIMQIKMIRELDQKHECHSAILADLQGPKLRIGDIEPNSVVSVGDSVTFYSDKPFVGNVKKAYLNYPHLAKDVAIGDSILINDGKLIFKVIQTDKKSKIITKTVQGGDFESKKGVNLPNTRMTIGALTSKDIEDAKFIFTQDVDWIALSFVRGAEDLLALKKLMSDFSEKTFPIISKIEKPQAIDNLDKIIELSNGIMVARGDLGVEIPAAQVPLVQKKLVLLSKKARIPVIIATQMLENMIDSLTPSRAEVNDVANSVFDGADAVMTSGETSVGKHPAKVISMMTSILKTVENADLIKIHLEQPKNIQTTRYITDSICFHAAKIANAINAKAICTLTNSGYTAYQISACRPSAYVLVFTSNKSLLSQLNLLWGVKTFYYEEGTKTDLIVEEVNQIALEKGYVEKGDFLVNLTYIPISEKGMVNTMRITTI
ncbi:MAG: pyruvate kinase [Flavobacteriaceae bacterium]|nr:pyruvate kinase [Flavobacteriaceae bacterium]MCY4267448.1 pyruvate kinase [Flavobacteriaceae bacterium]